MLWFCTAEAMLLNIVLELKEMCYDYLSQKKREGEREGVRNRLGMREMEINNVANGTDIHNFNFM